MTTPALRLYDDIGVGYARYRRADTRIAAAIMRALGSLAPVVNVGAGTGSYEPRDRRIVAVEPSCEMIRQRHDLTAPVVRASAMQLPFCDGAFAAGLAVLTIHHWPDRLLGIAELARVARERLVFVTYDPAFTGFWLVEDYFPSIASLDRKNMPPLETFDHAPGRVHIEALPIPHDCSDGFLGAYWRRPQAYLDPGVRGAISAFSRIPDVEAGLARLRADLEDGTWRRRNADLLRLTRLDLGYRLVVIDMERSDRDKARR